MKKIAGAFCISLLLLFCLMFQNMTPVRSASETEYYMKSKVSYLNRGDNIWNFTEREDDRTLGLFMNNSWQTVYLVNSTLSIETKTNDTDGNQIAVLQFPESTLNSGESIDFSVTYRVVSNPRTLSTINESPSEDLDEIPSPLKAEYSGVEGPWLVDDTALRNLAYNIIGTETNVLTIIKDLIAWISENISYKTHETPLYPNETLAWQEGDCDDQAILLITLCRIIGIPAFLQIGAIYAPNSTPTNESYWEDHVAVIQKQIAWHGWAMVYIPPWGWLPVDLTYVFGGLSNPLNAITNAAVTSQDTIQFMNISKFDYVESSRKTRSFLIDNDLYVEMEDEIIKTKGQWSPFGDIAERLFPVILVTAVTLLMIGVYFMVRRSKKEQEIPIPSLKE
ncbi:MAG: transglutaminase domain-containing protein [Candidatus Bathyarchaeota archaeon]|nr:MAG: transglutaminase domain-containing protein [Candidatus Bathyarchaeota archaeon]